MESLSNRLFNIISTREGPEDKMDAFLHSRSGKSQLYAEYVEHMLNAYYEKEKENILHHMIVHGSAPTTFELRGKKPTLVVVDEFWENTPVQPDLVVGDKVYDLKTIYDEYGSSSKKVHRFMQGYDIALSPSQKELALKVISADPPSFDLGNYRIGRKKDPVPFKKQAGTKRDKVLAKRAKDKANRKKARR